MNMIKAFFPFSFKAKSLKDLLITILVYIIADILCGIVIGVLGKLPLAGFVFSIIGWVAGIYFFAGIILAILNYLGVLAK